MHPEPKPPNPFRRLASDLRAADPLFWLAAALVAAIFLARYLFT